MAARFPDDFSWSRERRQRCPIVFRVEAEFANESLSTPGFDRQQNLSSRGPQRPTTEHVAMLHLTWKKYWPGTWHPFDSPFISLFTSYRRAMRRKDWFLREGATRVVVLAYDASNMKTLIDAQQLASHLNLRKLHVYDDEVLAVSEIVADDYSLLALMPTTSSWEIEMSSPQGPITLPEDYWSHHSFSRDLLEALRLEVYCHTGWTHDRRLEWLIRALKT